MSTCADLVDLLLEIKRNAARRYEAGALGLQPGLRPLFSSLGAQEEEHASVLAGIKRRGNLDLLFRTPEEPAPARTAEDPRQAGAGPLGPLEVALRNADRSIELLVYLESHARDSEVSSLLGRLAGETGRMRAMVASRRDLESLGG